MNTQQAADAAQAVSSAVGDVQEELSSSSKTAAEVASATAALNKEASGLQSKMGDFLSQVRSA
ncbi:MAG: hypothetical protein AAGC83_13205, partial [Pseudomonadota bacterium]